jgi:predicted aconitase
LWKNKDAKPKLCFIGCPHLSFAQINEWTDQIVSELAKNGKDRVQVRTIITASPQVVKKFMQTEKYEKLISTGVKVSSICPLMYVDNPIAGKQNIITCSNKLRTYSPARYYTNGEILKIITGGK